MQEPDTQQEYDDQEQPDAFDFLLQAADATRGSLDRAVERIALELADSAGTQNDMALTQAEAVERVHRAAVAIHEALTTTAAKTAKELGHLKNQAASQHEASGKRLVQHTQAIGQRLDTTTVHLEDISGAQSEHQALSADTRDRVISLSDVIAHDGAETREEVEAAMVLLRAAIDEAARTGDDVRGVKNALGMVIGSARDQVILNLREIAESNDEVSEQHGERLANIHLLLKHVVDAQNTHGNVLDGVHRHAEQTAQALPDALTRLLEAVTAADEDGRRVVLDAEQRLSAAVNLNAERAEQTIDSIAEGIEGFAGAFAGFSEQAATAPAVDALRDDVSALSDRLTASTQEVASAVQQAVSGMSTMVAAWNDVSRKILGEMESMSRTFLDKANASEHARDQAMIDLGRRLARLELDRAPEAVVS